MKILFVIHEFFPQHYTGTARFGLNLATQLQKMGNTIKILTYGETETDLQPFGNILTKKYLYDSLEVFSFRHRIMTPAVHFDIFNREIAEDVWRFIEQEKLDDVDLVHIIHPLRTGVVAEYFHRKKIPITMTLTDYWILCPRVQLLKLDDSICNGPSADKCPVECGFDCHTIFLRMQQAKALTEYVDVITVPSTLVKTIFAKNGYPVNRFHVINHGLNYQNFQIIPRREYQLNDPIVFGYVGPILAPKGIELLINAFMKVPGNNISLKIFGSHLNQNEYLAHLKDIAKSDSRISFLGEYKYENLSRIFSEIDVEIFSSIWYETYCLALLEGLAHNIPIIASNTVGSALEFFDNTSGMLFESCNCDHLAKKIEHISIDPRELNKIKEQIRYPPRIGEEAIQYEKIYSELTK